jgi:hypothetical protein
MALAESCEETDSLRELTEINARDLLTAFGLGHVQRGRRLLLKASHPPARRFAREALAFDAAVGEGGLRAGGIWVLQHFVARTTVHGEECLPRTGPLLVVANHPGLYDATAIFAAIPRDDMHVIAAERPFLRALPHTLRHLYLADDDPVSRRHVVRASVRHLRAGHALLTFPAGQIEPDPAVLPGAIEGLQRWQGHIEIFPRLVPDLQIMPAIVSGVLSRTMLHNPITLIRRSTKDRRWLAATLQVLLQRYLQVHVRVAFGVPISVAAFAGDTTAINEEIFAQARGLIRDVERGEVAIAKL